MGFTMTGLGGCLLSHQVIVFGSYWSFYGTHTFGITLVPMLISVAMAHSRQSVRFSR
jgi:hypothetical protein